MNARNRAGTTVEPDPDVGASTNGNGHGANGSGSGDTRLKRRSTTASGAPKPERGSASQRGTSSSSVTRRSLTDDPADASAAIPLPAPGVDEAAANGATASVEAAPAPASPAPSIFEPPEPPVPDAAAPSDPQAVAATVLEPPAPIALPAAPADLPAGEHDPTVFDDAATSDPFGIPTIETPDELAEDLEPLPLPLVTTPPAARGSQAQPLADPTWAPAALPDLPFEAPYVTSTTMTSHQVAPVPRVVGRRPRVRKVTRVVRHVDPWTVFKVALIFNLVVYGVLLTAGVLLWNVAYATGTIDNLERFFESFGWTEFEFNGGEIYNAAWIAGLFAVIGLTGAAVLGATLFNLITDLVGGVRFTVLEEEVVEKTTAPMRRFTVRRTGAANPGSVDLSAQPGTDLQQVAMPTVEQPAQPDDLAPR